MFGFIFFLNTFIIYLNTEYNSICIREYFGSYFVPWVFLCWTKNYLIFTLLYMIQKDHWNDCVILYCVIEQRLAEFLLSSTSLGFIWRLWIILQNYKASILYFSLFHFDRSEFYWVMEMNNFSAFHYIPNWFLNFNDLESKGLLCQRLEGNMDSRLQRL